MKVCSKCDVKHYALGLCRNHYGQLRNSEWRLKHRDEHLARRKQLSRSIGQKFSKLKSVARNKGLEMTLTLDQFTTLNSLPCEYCSEPLAETGYGIDRKDNSVGYIPDNSLPCCTRCNTMKGAYLSYGEMKLIWRLRQWTRTQSSIQRNLRKKSSG